MLGQGFVFPDEEEEEEEEPVQNPRKAESLQEAPGLGGASANSFDGRDILHWILIFGHFLS